MYNTVLSVLLKLHHVHNDVKEQSRFLSSQTEILSIRVMIWASLQGCGSFE